MPNVLKDETGRVITVQMDQVVDVNHPLAVQVPPEADGSQEHALAPLLEPSPNDLAEAAMADEDEAAEDED